MDVQLRLDLSHASRGSQGGPLPPRPSPLCRLEGRSWGLGEDRKHPRGCLSTVEAWLVGLLGAWLGLGGGRS